MKKKIAIFLIVIIFCVYGYVNANQKDKEACINNIVHVIIEQGDILKLVPKINNEGKTTSCKTNFER